MTMNGWMKLAAALFAAASFAGCSLLKVAVATGDPLSKEQMNVRTMTRGFYYDMAGEVARAAESLTDLLDPEKAENDPEIFRAHIRLTDIAKRVCAAADSLVALADARNHTIRR